MLSQCLRILVFTLSLSTYYCERTSSLTPVHQSLETFAKNLLKEIVHEDNEDGRYTRNLVVSPVGVWSAMTLLSEGASGDTETQLRAALNLTSDASVARRGYRSILKAMLSTSRGNGSNTAIECANAIFADANRPPLPDFEYVAESHYAAAVHGVPLSDPPRAALAVNAWVSSATHNRIANIVSAGDIADAELLVANAVFFQGSWALPFNSTFTADRPFYADYGRGTDEQLVARVPMMYQSGPFKMAVVDALKAQVLELPYEGGGLSMLVLLPFKGTALAEVFDRLRGATLDDLLRTLDAQSHEDDDESIDVFLPRFSLGTRVQLKEHLQKLGVSDLFDAARCDLRRLSRSRIYVSQVLHRAEIRVAEEGTVASAVTVATINNFSMPTVFNANHPFLFIVIERGTKAIVFAGKVSNPSAP